MRWASGGFAVVGHDWGGRTAYALAAIAPERLTALAALAVGYTPRGAFPVPGFEQSRRWWYQWFMTFDQGAEALARDPVAFDRLQWESWSPPGWFDDAEFAATAESFLNPDWVAITLHAYRSRWQAEPCDPRYAELQERIETTETLRPPSLLVQGAADMCDPPSESEGQERHYAGAFHRIVLDGIGHFPAREAPVPTTDAIIAHLEACGWAA